METERKVSFGPTVKVSHGRGSSGASQPGNSSKGDGPSTLEMSTEQFHSSYKKTVQEPVKDKLAGGPLDYFMLLTGSSQLKSVDKNTAQTKRIIRCVFDDNCPNVSQIKVQPSTSSKSHKRRLYMFLNVLNAIIEHYESCHTTPSNEEQERLEIVRQRRTEVEQEIEQEKKERECVKESQRRESESKKRDSASAQAWADSAGLW
ncbi:uncharacterized protein FOMMEDRAFT_28315 [Fomitiporia mediterranea MF3/22]|uniref:uncharacterized protein n=1 Tax=Fomitiporia mediterranea (strain MF3/22) TaxID=694068 RepID=UPI0004409A15|nr:uncharacterized protein FOMMEDRAFT_28315 [Fomitiporia mediterranea MF3/22]EJD02572.1 hypothetical protein FOMMEDRAFT_28315 [Fomitiporia mediterranea MF3/22]